MIKEIILFSKNSRARSIIPQEKFILCILIIVFNGYFNSFRQFLINFVVLIFLHLKYETPIIKVLKYVFSLTLFYILSGITFLIDGNFSLFYLMCYRGFINSLSITFFIFTTPLDDILFIMSKNKALIDLVDIAKLMERFIIVLEDEFSIMIKSAKSKGGFDSNIKMIKTSAKIGALLFKNMFFKWQEIKVSVDSRCFNGKLSYFDVSFKKSFLIEILIVFLFIINLIILDCM
jgi:cobalt/nickel transport system permease protein